LAEQTIKKKRRHILTVLGIVLGLCVLVLACIPIYLNSGHAQAVAVRLIDRSIPGEVRWHNLQLSLFKGRLEVWELRVKGRDASDIAGFDHVRITWSWPDLFKGELLVRGALEKPWAHLEQDADGNLNLTEAFSSPAPESPEEASPAQFPLNVNIDSFQVNGGSFRFRESVTPVSVELEGIALNLSGNLAQAVAHAQLHFKEGRFRLKEFKTGLKSSSLKARYTDNRVDAIHIELATDTVRAVITGDVEDPLNNQVLNLDGDLSAGLADIARLLDLEATLDGIATLEIGVRGVPNNPDVDLNLSYGGGVLFDRTIDSMASTVNLTDRRLNVEDLTVISGTGKLHLEGIADLQPVFPGGLFDSNPDFDALTYQVQLEQTELSLKALLGQAAGVAGEVDARISLSGQGVSLDNLKAVGPVEAEGRHISVNEKVPPVTVRLRSKLELDHGRVSLHELSAEAGDLNLEARGQVDLNTNTISTEFRLEAPDLSGSLTPLGIGGVKGNAHVNGNISGTFQQPQFNFLFEGSGLAYNDLRLGDVRLDAAMDAGGMLRLARLSVENQGSVLRGEGNIQLLTDSRQLASNPPIDLELTLSDIEAGDFVDADLATGRLDGSVKLEGTSRAPHARLKLEGKDIGVENISVGDVTARLEFHDGGLTLENVKVVNDDAVVQIKGTAQLMDPGTFEFIQDPAINLDVAGSHIELGNYLTGYEGRFSLDAHLEGNLKSPHGPLTIRGQGFKSPWQNVEEIDLTGRLEGDSLKVDRLVLLAAPAESVNLSGRVYMDSLAEVIIATEGISLAHIQPLKENVPVAGKLSCRLEVDGPYNNLNASGNLELTQFMAGGKSLEDLQADVGMQDHEIRLQVRHAAADLDVAYHLLTKAISGNARIDTDDLNPYFALFELNDFGGLIHGEFRIDGNLENIKQMTVSGNLESIRLDLKNQEVLRTKNALLSYERGEFQIPGWDLRLLDRGNLRVKGSGRMGSVIDLSAEGQLPLAVGSMFHEDLDDLTGDLLISAAVIGGWEQPDIQGTLRLQAAAMTLPGLDQIVHGVNGLVKLTPTGITVSGLNGNFDEGRFSLSGKAALDRFKPGEVDFTLSTTNLPIRVPDMLDIFFDGSLRLKGTPEKATLSGSMVMLDGSYYKDVVLNPLDLLKPKEERKVKPKPPDMTLPYLKNLKLNVEITGRNPFLVENNLAELEVMPDIRIMGSLKRPQMIGRADIPDGIIKFQTRKFEVVRGSIDFIDPYEIVPEMDIRGVTEIRQWTIFVDVTGPVDNLELRLSSDPSEEPGDILSLILIGRTSRELIAGEGGESSSATADILAGLANSPLGEGLKGITGLDTIEAETVADSDADRDSTQVTIGKNLSERITLKYGVETKEGNLIRKTIAEYRLLEHVLVSGFQDSDGIYGGALVYRIEFR
jgi:translocation and assembly module TamB